MDSKACSNTSLGATRPDTIASLQRVMSREGNSEGLIPSFAQLPIPSATPGRDPTIISRASHFFCLPAAVQAAVRVTK